jgi:hypothetical protein
MPEMAQGVPEMAQGVSGMAQASGPLQFIGISN